ncbi:winged helix-turn-helix domain-containing protein [Streptomyces eurythermus]|uniref:winged helix-turn-helix domain-containing protein n=1 Tax=Streptomyces eurythermus TaxID=42237 RepID=UPI0036FC226A
MRAPVDDSVSAAQPGLRYHLAYQPDRLPLGVGGLGALRGAGAGQGGAGTADVGGRRHRGEPGRSGLCQQGLVDTLVRQLGNLGVRVGVGSADPFRKLLVRSGWSCQVPARRAVEGDDEVVAGWVKEVWPCAEDSRR